MIEDFYLHVYPWATVLAYTAALLVSFPAPVITCHAWNLSWETDILNMTGLLHIFITSPSSKLM